MNLTLRHCLNYDRNIVRTRCEFHATFNHKNIHCYYKTNRANRALNLRKLNHLSKR